MKKLLIAIILIASPLMGQETMIKLKTQPYFQRVGQKFFLSVLGVVSPTLLWNEDCQLQPIEGLGGINIEAFGRITQANVFYTVKIKGLIPFYGIYGNRTLTKLNYIISSGLGGVLYDKRDEYGIGSFMMMDFTFFFYPLTQLRSFGIGVDTRYSYSINRITSLTVGLDLLYTVLLEKNINAFHNFSIGFAFGFTFNTFNTK